MYVYKEIEWKLFFQLVIIIWRIYVSSYKLGNRDVIVDSLEYLKGKIIY